jgi:chromosome segregation ATPase
MASLKDQTNKIFKAIQEKSSEQDNILENAKQDNEQIETLAEKIKILRTRAEENEQEVANKKKTILAFNNSIENTQKQVKTIITQDLEFFWSLR